MISRKPGILYIILAALALLVIWIPVLEQILTPGDSAFSLESWLLLSVMATLGLVLLFFLLYMVSRRK